MYPLFATCSLCSLYNWRYTKLGDLPHVQTWPEYCVENPGFFFDYQLIDVPDFNGVGESEPNPYFYQVQKYLVVSWCCGHQWRNTKDWKDTEQYQHHNTKANKQ